MSKHVVLMAETMGAPAPALREALREAGVEVAVSAERGFEVAVKTEPNGGNSATPLAVLYELEMEANTMQLYAVIERATLLWPDVPLVACRHYGNGQAKPGRASFDDAALKRLGFKAVAASPAQLPALLREMEERGRTGDLQLPVSIANLADPGSLLLPRGLRNTILRAAFELVASLHFATDQKSAAQTALAGLASLIPAQRWAIYLTPEQSGAAETDKLEPLAARGLTESVREATENDWRKALMGEALMLSGAESKAAHESVMSGETVRRREKSLRVVAVPLLGGGERVMGVLEAVREGQGARLFSQAEASLLGALALPIASALSNSVRIAEAERLSLTDDLTKLHNARFLRQFLLSEIKRARRYGSVVAAFFLDIDDFKSINDRHGHLVGSHVLMEMASVILSSVRDTDVVARYGGDEFVIILPESALEQALLVAERVREKIERHQFHGGRSLSLYLTASFGVAAFPLHAQSPQQLIACADSAMYEAKAANKNCIRVAAAPLPPTF